MSALPKNYVTPEEYLAIDRASNVHHEYINGEILDMTGGSFEYNRIALNVFRVLDAPLDSQGCEIFINDVRVKVQATGAYMYPDVIMVCGEHEAEDEWGDTLLNPIILIEYYLHPRNRMTVATNGRIIKGFHTFKSIYL